MGPIPGNLYSLRARITPEDATNKNVVWTTNHAGVRINGDSFSLDPDFKSTATLTARAGAVSSTCTVQYVGKDPFVDQGPYATKVMPNLIYAKMSYSADTPYKIDLLSIEPAGRTIADVLFTTYNKGGISVDGDGTVRAHTRILGETIVHITDLANRRIGSVTIDLVP